MNRRKPFRVEVVQTNAFYLHLDARDEADAKQRANLILKSHHFASGAPRVEFPEYEIISAMESTNESTANAIN